MTIHAEDISFAFRQKKLILENITALAETGRITTIIGPNAAGKTTLLRILAGVLKPQTGVVRLNGKPLADYNPRTRARKLAYVAQRTVVDAPFTVLDVLELGAFARERGKPSAINQIIESCKLSALVNTLFHELSVGQQQRVALARALVQLHGGGKGTTLLLDEPLSAMDPQHIQQTGKLLRASARRGTAVLIVLHDLGLAGLLADDVWALQAGQLQAAGPIAATLNIPLLEKMYGSKFQLHQAGSNTRLEPNYEFKKIPVSSENET